MTEYRHPILIQGGYQVMAITDGREYDPSEILAYEVMTLSGAKIRHELTLESARVWLERLAGEETQQQEQDPQLPPVERTSKRRASKRGKGVGVGRKLLRFLG
ncbi:hypothetical protein [Luteimonas aquatica]|uniref:hypothetical protein n=1 Tax=Luteimonas aquatica TaxID=450364 RepID=UPI001F58F512|nr:hypothetical protein [Luteimonas aquatica]